MVTRKGRHRDSAVRPRGVEGSRGLRDRTVDAKAV